VIHRHCVRHLRICLSNKLTFSISRTPPSHPPPRHPEQCLTLHAPLEPFSLLVKEKRRKIPSSSNGSLVFHTFYLLFADGTEILRCLRGRAIKKFVHLKESVTIERLRKNAFSRKSNIKSLISLFHLRFRWPSNAGTLSTFPFSVLNPRPSMKLLRIINLRSDEESASTHVLSTLFFTEAELNEF
jgi:hypothetical protein